MREELYYDLEKKEEPSCQVIVAFRSPRDHELFVELLRSFASDHGLIEGVEPEPAFVSPMQILPTFLGEDMLLSAFCFPCFPEGYGQASLSLLRRDLRLTFRHRAKSFASLFQEAFPSQAQIHNNSIPKI